MRLSASHLLRRAPDRRASLGKLVAQLLAGSWRNPTSKLSAEELAEISALLAGSGGAGLAWCAVRNTELKSSSEAERLHQSYRLHSIEAALHRREIKRVIPILEQEGIRPLVVKGWAVARLYPELGMRPYCDLDLCVRPDQYDRARAVVAGIKGLLYSVDLHDGFGKFYDRRTEEVFERSEEVPLEDVNVRVLCAEDHLRYICMHLLRHGAVRPLWLCDVAVMVETRGEGFDWDRCLAGSRREADWVACAIGLASVLLGLDVDQTPIGRRARQLPAWFVPAVLRGWGAPYRGLGQLRALLRQPVLFLRELPEEIGRHWPNPIEATMTLGGPFNEAPRLAFQLGHVFRRASESFSQSIRERGPRPASAHHS
jgi:hypothetical protein